MIKSSASNKSIYVTKTKVIGGNNGSILFVDSSKNVNQDITTNANFFWDQTNHRLGIGTTTPGEILNMFQATGNFTTIRYDSGNTQGYFFAYDGDNSVNIGSNSNSQVNFKVNNATKVSIDTSGNLYPVGNKLQTLGLTTLRWNVIYYVTATTGTSRLTEAKTICKNCNVSMMRGTGTTVILGETEDYIPTFCTKCGLTGFDTLQNLPKEKLKERQPAPKIIFKGFSIDQLSGNSRFIRVNFQYKDDTVKEIKIKEMTSDGQKKEVIKRITTPGLYNSTILGEKEIELYLTMNEQERKQFLKKLGQREWDSLEEARLMKEQVEQEQTKFDELNSNFVGKDLLI